MGRITAVLVATGTGSLHGQVVLDGKFGTSGSLPGPNYNIAAAAGATRGDNLFHSFKQFDLKSGDVATFAGPSTIKNILGRITGGSSSTIDGTIRSGIAGANLFLINPAGVMFGPNAVVDVDGSFAIGSANYLKLGDGAKFQAALGADDSMLSTAPVVAFGFLDGNSGSVEIKGSITTGRSGSITAVGSAVAVSEGTRLQANGGLITLAGFVGAGELTQPTPTAPTTAPPVPSAGRVTGADIVIRGGKLVGNNALISASSGGGNIDISTSTGVEVVNGAQVTTSSQGVIRGGNIRIDSPSLLIDGFDGEFPTRIAAETASDEALGKGGNIFINANSIQMRRGSEISVSTFGAADAGLLELRTSTLLMQGSDLSFFPTQISANAAPGVGTITGSGGKVVIHADSVEIANGAVLLAQTLGDANAGSIDIDARSLTLNNGGITTYSGGNGSGGAIKVRSDALTLDGPFASLNALTTGAGTGGLMDINIGALRLLNDASISASTYGEGNGGNIRITADSIVLDRATFQKGSIPGITAASKPSFFGGGGGGKGGDISIDTRSLELRHSMPISTTTDTIGNGGNIDIRASTLVMDSGSSIQSASIGKGRAGTLAIRSEQELTLNGKSTISTSAPLSSGGDIKVDALGRVKLFDSKITAQAGPGGGGSIVLNSPSLVYLLDSTFTAQAVGDGGNLTISGPNFFILNRANLVSKSSTANGGNIAILSDYFFQSASIIDASAPFGLPGTVSVSAPNVDLSGSLVGLPSNLLGLENELRPDCGIRLSGNASSLILLGRGGLPIEPGGFLPSGPIATKP